MVGNGANEETSFSFGGTLSGHVRTTTGGPACESSSGAREKVQQDASHAHTHKRLGQHDTANPEGDRLAYPRRPAGQASGQASISHVRGSVTLGNKVFARMGVSCCAWLALQTLRIAFHFSGKQCAFPRRSYYLLNQHLPLSPPWLACLQKNWIRRLLRFATFACRYEKSLAPGSSLWSASAAQ